MISAPVKAELEAKLQQFEAAESTQIVILTIPSLQGDPIENFSIRVVEAWKIGHKGSDNGVLLIVSRDDHKVRIEVGYGLEGRLTDLLSGRIINDEIVPAFKASQFDAGFTRGVDAIIAAVHGEYKAKPQAEREWQQALISPAYHYSAGDLFYQPDFPWSQRGGPMEWWSWRRILWRWLRQWWTEVVAALAAAAVVLAAAERQVIGRSREKHEVEL